MNTRPLPTDALTTAQAARQLGVSTQTVQKWVDLGLLRAWKTLGGHRRVSAASVQSLLAARDSAPVSGHQDAEPAVRRSITIMLVEDDSSEAELLGELLEGLFGKRANIVHHDNPFDALLHAGRHPPDVLLTDVNMPGMDGLAMVTRLLSNPMMNQTRIALVTNFAREEVERLGPIPERVLYLRKPVTRAVLLDALNFLGND
ncbi:MAG TPA: response regulator [Burkholderiaceae bacterium]|nr:response regulator [Burkholderiaceae bacterium]